jgi:hypothetical protein
MPRILHEWTELVFTFANDFDLLPGHYGITDSPRKSWSSSSAWSAVPR